MVADLSPVRRIASGAEQNLWSNAGSDGGTFNPADPAGLTASTVPTLTTNGVGGQARTTLALPPNRGFNLRGAALAIVIRISDVSKLAALNVYVGSAGLGQHYRWDLVSASGPKYGVSGRYATLILNPEDAQETIGTVPSLAIRDVRVRVADDGTGPISMSIDRIGVVPTRVARPGGVWTLSLDDNFSSQMPVVRYAASVGVRGTLYVIRDMVGQAGYLTLDELHEAQHDHGWQIAAHANTVNAHNNRLTSLTPEQLEDELSELKAWMTAEGFNGANDYCYPAGVYDGPVLDAVRRHFPNSARTTYRLGSELVSPLDPHLLRANALGGHLTLAAAKKHIDQANLGASWMHHYGHRFITEGTPGGVEWRMTDVYALIDYALESGIEIRRLDEVMR